MRSWPHPVNTIQLNQQKVAAINYALADFIAIEGIKFIQEPD
jgi:hypothetical protein